MEAYVDIIVIKSKPEADHIADLHETFNSLRAAGVWLNPEKCVFSDRAGKLLGYLVSQRGIDVNPDKIYAITDMAPTTNARGGVQRLAGHLAALSWFLARSAEHNLPLFKTPRGSEPFRCSAECQSPFEAFKAHMSDLKTLAIPSPSEGLLLYLFTSASTVSAVLVQEGENEGRSV